MSGFSITRKLLYIRRHGVRNGLSRAVEYVHQMSAGGWMTIYSCPVGTSQSSQLPPDVTIERFRTGGALAEPDLACIEGIGHGPEIRSLVLRRFEANASLWLYRVGGRIAGYGWSLAGNTFEPYFFPLEGNDAHLFDFYVFAQFRGQKINPMLVNFVLSKLSEEGAHRALIEVAQWNRPQVRSLRHTPFRSIGMARQCKIFGRRFIEWREIAAEE